MVDLSNAKALLNGTLSDGTGTGWQLSVIADEGSWTASAGYDAIGSELTDSSRFCTYCAIKPLLATAIGVAVGDGEMSWLDQLGDLLPDAADELRTLTIRQLLDHSAGVARPTAIEAATLPLDLRLRVALESRLLSLSSTQSAYSEAASWMLAGAALTAAVGVPLVSYVRHRVLEPLGVDGEFDLGAEPSDDGRFRLNITTSANRRWPVLLERTDRMDWSSNPGYGGRVSTCGLAALAFEVVRALSGRGCVLDAAEAGELVRSAGPRDDRVWGRRCSFGAGWLTGLEEHRFGSHVTSSAFGQVGLVGMTTVWAEPEVGYAAAIHMNGMSDGVTAIDWLRPAMVRAIATAVGTQPASR